MKWLIFYETVDTCEIVDFYEPVSIYGTVDIF